MHQTAIIRVTSFSLDIPTYFRNVPYFPCKSRVLLRKMSFFAHLCYFAKESLGSFSTVAAEALVTLCVEDGYNKFTYGTPPPVPANVTPHSIAEPVKVVATVSRETQLPFFKLAFENDTAV